MKLDRDDLRGKTVTEVLALLEKGKVGHSAVMDYLRIDNLNELVEIMHLNDRQMPGHRPMPIRRETLELLKQITRLLPEKNAAE